MVQVGNVQTSNNNNICLRRSGVVVVKVMKIVKTPVKITYTTAFSSNFNNEKQRKTQSHCTHFCFQNANILFQGGHACNLFI